MKRTPIHEMAEGTVVGGRYQLERLLGIGGFGRVYQAIQMPLSRRVAVKLLATTQAGVSARFAREASLAQRLEHPNTVRILDFGATPDGAPFIVFELLRGMTVSELLARHGPMPLDVALEIAAQVLKSLMEAHALGIVHRDVKPANVMVTSHPGEPYFVKVLDFGIAKDVTTPAGSPRAASLSNALSGSNAALTSGSEMMGTPRYMAPEQALGEATGPETDVYAVGLMLAEMLRGRPVFDQENALAVAMEQASAAPVPLGALASSPAGAILVRATQKDRRLRYPSAGEMLADLDRLQGKPSQAPGTIRLDEQRVAVAITTDPTKLTPSADARKVEQQVGRRSVWLGLGAIALAGAVGAGAMYLLTREDPKPKRKRKSEAEETEDEQEEDGVDRLPDPPEVDFSKRSAPTAEVLAKRLRGTGYKIVDGAVIDQAGFSQWTYEARKPPCGGIVLLQQHGSTESAKIAEEALRGQGKGLVVRTDNRLLYVALGRVETVNAYDPRCTIPLADKVTR